jgi:hypothetical protein
MKYDDRRLNDVRSLIKDEEVEQGGVDLTDGRGRSFLVNEFLEERKDVHDSYGRHISAHFS